MTKYLLIAALVFLGVYGLSNAAIYNPAQITNAVITTGTINYTTSSVPLVWTNNTSKTFIPTDIYGLTLTATNVTVEPSASLKRGDTADIAGDIGPAISSGAVDTLKIYNIVGVSAFYPVGPGDTMTLTITAGTADAHTGRVIITGIYY